MRVVKAHNERMNEILDTAQRLIVQKGYEKCTVSDILNEIGIAKGTFYHYFKSKEEVLDAIIDRATQMMLSGVKVVVDNSNITFSEKIMGCFLALRVEDKMEPGLLEEMHQPQNALMHQKSLNSMIKELTPILVNIVNGGVMIGEFKCDYPKEYMQIFLSSAMVLLDDGMFHVSEEEQQIAFKALISLLCKMLTLDEANVWEMVQANWNRK